MNYPVINLKSKKMHYNPDNTEFLASLSTIKQPESETNYWPTIFIIVGGIAVAFYFYYRQPTMLSTNLEDKPKRMAI